LKNRGYLRIRGMLIGVIGINKIIIEERWLNGSALDCNAAVLGSNPAHSPSHEKPRQVLRWAAIWNYTGVHLRGGRGTKKCTKTP
jgi:hypothetical protein